jgi:hypothetical protein
MDAWLHLPVLYTIYFGNEVASSSVGDEDRYVIIRMLLYPIMHSTSVSLPTQRMTWPRFVEQVDLSCSMEVQADVV